MSAVRALPPVALLLLVLATGAAARDGGGHEIVNRKAADFHSRSGGAAAGTYPDWRLEPGGFIETHVPVPNAGRHELVLRGYDPAPARAGNGAIPHAVRIAVDGKPIGETVFRGDGLLTRRLAAGSIESGFHTIRLSLDGPAQRPPTGGVTLRDLVIVALEEEGGPRPHDTGLFPQQSISILSGEFGQQFWGTDGMHCRGTGCLAIDFVKAFFQ